DNDVPAPVSHEALAFRRVLHRHVCQAVLRLRDATGDEAETRIDGYRGKRRVDDEPVAARSGLGVLPKRTGNALPLRVFAYEQMVEMRAVAQGDHAAQACRTLCHVVAEVR